MHDPTCFLCHPDRNLVYAQNKDYFAMSGLGPLVPAYSLVAPRKHIRSSADIETDGNETLVAFLLKIRQQLQKYFTTCTVAEHGRVPICLRVANMSEAHCYHAHFLLFPTAPRVDLLAVANYKCVQLFGSLQEALETASLNAAEYVLVSSHEDRYLLLTDARKQVRQFSRHLVASTIGKPELANWQAYPDYDVACRQASVLKKLIRA